jgi:hypothetical protein
MNPKISNLKSSSLKSAKSRPQSHLTNLTSANLAAASMSRSQIAKRRSNRMTLNATVGLSGEDRQKCSFTMPARATSLNQHGAAVQLSRELQIGSVVVLRHQNGTQVSARVVARLTAQQGVSTYGIEFVERDEHTKNFWGITFPSNA